MSRRTDAAIERAQALAATPWKPVPPGQRAHGRRVAIGDPQASFEKLARILDEHALLGEDGFLSRDASLVSMGDHFDYSAPESREAIGLEGMKILRWLAEHPPDQVVLLAGNHDLSRVMELAKETDATFARARQAARSVEELRKKKDRSPDEESELARRRAGFQEEFPDLATAEMADRDYVTFTETQRSLVQALLVGGRFRLAATARTLDGRPLLLAHAGVTRRELSLLGIEGEEDPERIAGSLNAFLDSAVARVAPSWRRGELVALDLGEVHKAGHGGREGGGLLYHRPVSPPREDEPALAPRKYDPLDLPRLAQACGHTGHKKSLMDLRAVSAPSAFAFLRGGLRTLSVNGDRVVYEAGIVPGAERVLHMIDAEMNYVAHDAYPVLELSPTG